MQNSMNYLKGNNTSRYEYGMHSSSGSRKSKVEINANPV